MSKQPSKTRLGKSWNATKQERAKEHNLKYEEQRIKEFSEALERVTITDSNRPIKGQEVSRLNRGGDPGKIILINGAEHGRMMAREMIEQMKDKIEPKVMTDGTEPRNQTTYPKRYLERN